jgi:hypothetical protein
VNLPAGLENPAFARALAGQGELWAHAEENPRVLKAYAFGVSSYFDPGVRRRETTPRPRSPLLDTPECATLTSTAASAYATLNDWFNRTLARAGTTINLGAFDTYTSYVNGGFSDAHTLITAPSSGCRAAGIRALVDNVQNVANDRYSDFFFTGSTHGPVTATDLSVGASPDTAMVAAATALAAARFEVLRCTYSGIANPVVTWYRASPSMRLVRGLDPGFVDLANRALGSVVLDECPVTYEGMQHRRRPQ